MEYSHLLQEQPAHSAKEENLPLARARHRTAPYTPPLQRLLALRALHAGQGVGRCHFQTWDNLDTPHTHRRRCLPRKTPHLLSPNFPRRKSGLLIYQPSRVGRRAPLHSSAVDPWGVHVGINPKQHVLQKLLCRQSPSLVPSHPSCTPPGATLSAVSQGFLEEARRGEEARMGKQ